MSRAGPGLVDEYALNDRQALGRTRHRESFDIATCKTELLRLNGKHAHLSVLELGYARRRADGNLVHAVLGMHHEHVLATELLQYLGQRLDPVRGKNADHLVGAPAGLVRGPSRLNTVRTPISRRGPMACFMAAWNFGANRKPTPISFTHRATCSGVSSSETPAASSTSALPDLLETERLPCFATPPAGGGDYECGGSRDIKGMYPVAAGTAGIHQMRTADVDACREFAHDFRGASDLLHGLTLHAQSDEEAADLRRRRGAGHDQTHDRAHRVGGERLCRSVTARIAVCMSMIRLPDSVLGSWPTGRARAASKWTRDETARLQPRASCGARP